MTEKNEASCEKWPPFMERCHENLNPNFIFIGAKQNYSLIIIFIEKMKVISVANVEQQQNLCMKQFLKCSYDGLLNTLHHFDHQNSNWKESNKNLLVSS